MDKERILVVRRKKKPASALAIVFNADGRSTNIYPDDITGRTVAVSNLESVRSAKRVQIRQLRQILDWPPLARVALFIFFQDCGNICSASQSNHKYETRYVYEALLDCYPGTGEPSRYGLWLKSCLEWIAVGDELQITLLCGQLRSALRKRKVPADTLNRLIKQVREIRESIRASARAEDCESLRDALKRLPDGLPSDCLVPSGWQLSEEGITRLTANGSVPVCAVPMIITAVHEQLVTDHKLVTIAWLARDTWVQRIVGREQIADRRKVVDLAAFGAPVSSNNAGDVVQFLADFEALNAATLPHVKVSSQLGWQGSDGELGFLYGQTHIPLSDGDEAVGGEGAQPLIKVAFAGADTGDKQLADGFSKKGSFEKWKKAMARVAPYPMVRLAFYLGFVAPLLRILRVPNFCVDFAGPTTTGKTTTARFMASAWGDPDENRPGSMLKKFDGTAVWLERLPTVMGDVPIFLDETQHAAEPGIVKRVVYGFTQGRNRGRGTVKGLQEQATWHSVLVTTGEQPATAFSQDGGTRPRVLTLWGSPFGGQDADTARLIREVNAVIEANHGHAGREFVRHLAEHPDDWPTWRSEHNLLTKHYEDRAENDYVRRQSPIFAAIRVAVRLAHKALNLPWEATDPIQPLWAVLTREAAAADRAMEAAKVVMDWAVAYQDRFQGRHNRDHPPVGGWAGAWRRDGDVPAGATDSAKWKWIAFIPTVLNEVLRKNGFDAEAIVRNWHDRGWLAGNKGRRQRKVRIQKELVMMTAIRREAFE